MRGFIVRLGPQGNTLGVFHIIDSRELVLYCISDTRLWGHVRENSCSTKSAI